MQNTTRPYRKRIDKKYLCTLSSVTVSLLLTLLLPQITLASIHTGNRASCSPTNATLPTSGTSGTAQARPNANSLLIVIMDRSACTGAVDPANYSASITDVLSDFWPGQMAVILQGKSVSVIGPFPPGRVNLKSQINNAVFGGNTSLVQSMSAAQTLLQQQNFPAGSRILLVSTVSVATGNISTLSQDIAMFARKGVSISTIGLQSLHNSNQGAETLLQQIANATNGNYYAIETPAGMEQAVTELYATWTGQEFRSLSYNQVSGDYTLDLDGTFQNAYLLTFYDNSSQCPVANDGSQYCNRLTIGGQSIRGNIRSLFNSHYEKDTLSLPLQSGSYQVALTTQGNGNVQVYALTLSTISLSLIQPTPKSSIISGSTITIAAHIQQQGIGAIIPNQNTVFQAQVVETFFNHQKRSTIVPMSPSQSGSDIYKGIYAVPADGKMGPRAVQLGTITITVTSTEQGIVHTTLPLTFSLFVPKAPPPPPCRGNILQCEVLPNLWLFIIAISAVILGVVLLILCVRQRNAPEPFGYLVNSETENSIDLSMIWMRRPRWKNLIYKSSIDMQEDTVRRSFPYLAKKPLRLVFQKERGRVQAYMQLMKGINEPSVCIKNGEDTASFSRRQRKIMLGNESEISVNQGHIDQNIAIFKIQHFQPEDE